MKNTSTSIAEEIQSRMLPGTLFRASYFVSSKAELDGDPCEIVFGAVRVKRGFEVLSLDSGTVQSHGIFPTKAEAAEAAKNTAMEVQSVAKDFLDAQKDREWSELPDLSESVFAPFRFSDTTDYRGGILLHSLEALLEHCYRNDHLFHPEEWGNAYHYRLEDMLGTPFQVLRSHRDEYRLIPA